MGLVKFNGINSADLGLIVQFIPTYSYPSKEYETLHIPGRNGDLVIDKGSYQNVERTYSFAKVYKRGEKFVPVANSIVSWLHSATGYARLEDSYEPEYYRLAMFKSDGEMSDYYNEATALEVTFECKPQRWLVSGDKEISLNNGSKLKNPTSFDSSPIIKFKPLQSNMWIQIGDIKMSLSSIPSGTTEELIIDCENMECYDPNNNILYNSKLTLDNGEFTKFKGNELTEITFDGMENVTIQPRWWTL